MNRAADNATIELWRIQGRLGIKPAERRLPSPANDRDSFERDLQIIRQTMAQAAE